MLQQIVPPHAYLDFSFILCGVQQGHFEGGGFKSFGTFLGRFEVFAWGRPLRHVICFSVFVKMLGVLFLKIKNGSQMDIQCHLSALIPEWKFKTVIIL